MKRIKKLFKSILSTFYVEQEVVTTPKDNLSIQERNILDYFTRLHRNNMITSLLDDEAVKIFNLEVFHPDFESLIKGAPESETRDLKIVSTEYFFTDTRSFNGSLFRLCRKIESGNLTFRERKDLTTLVKMFQFYLGD